MWVLPLSPGAHHSPCWPSPTFRVENFFLIPPRTPLALPLSFTNSTEVLPTSFRSLCQFFPPLHEKLHVDLRKPFLRYCENQLLNTLTWQKVLKQMFKHVFFLRKTRNFAFELEFYFSAYLNKPFFYTFVHMSNGVWNLQVVLNVCKRLFLALNFRGNSNFFQEKPSVENLRTKLNQSKE